VSSMAHLPGGQDGRCDRIPSPGSERHDTSIGRLSRSSVRESRGTTFWRQAARRGRAFSAALIRIKVKTRKALTRGVGGGSIHSLEPLELLHDVEDHGEAS
jgi:hypothetical protein